MTKQYSKNRTPKTETLRFDERGLPLKSLGAKREAFVATVESNPSAHVEILAIDQEGVNFWMRALDGIRFTDRPSLRVELHGPNTETPVDDRDLSPPLEADIKARMYYGSKNAVYALESYCASIEAGQYPEWPILKFLEKSFRQSLEYHRLNDAKPKNSLDHILGLSSKKGGTPAWRTGLNAERDQMLLLDMATLRSLDLVQKITIVEAAKMVAARLAKTPAWDKSAWRLKRLSVKSLEGKYANWSRHDEIELQLKNEQTSKWSPKDKREYLGKFPEYSRPPWLNQILDK